MCELVVSVEAVDDGVLIGVLDKGCRLVLRGNGGGADGPTSMLLVEMWRRFDILVTVGKSVAQNDQLATEITCGLGPASARGITRTRGRDAST